MRVYYDRDADLNLIKGEEGRHHRLWQPGARARAEPARFRRARTWPWACGPGSKSAAKAEKAGLKVMDVPDAAKWADVVMMLTPDELQAGIWEKDLEAQHAAGHGAVLRPRPQHPFQPDRAASRHGYLHGGAEGPRPHGARRIYARRRRALPHGHRPGRDRQRARSYALLCRRHRRRPRRHHRDQFPRGMRDRSVRRAVGAVRRPRRADAQRLRDAGRRRLRAGDGLFRMRARGEADRRPHL